jgi:hypothetical protein
MSAAPETAARRWQSNTRWGAATLESLAHRRKEGWGEVDVFAVWGARAMTWAGWFALGMLSLAVLAILLLAVVTVTGAGGFVES